MFNFFLGGGDYLNFGKRKRERGMQKKKAPLQMGVNNTPFFTIIFDV